MKCMKLLFILLCITPLIFASCEISFDGDKVRVKGVTLEHSRIITISDLSQPETFIIDVSYGDIALEGGDSFELDVKVWEKIEGDVSVSIKDGKLVGETESGKQFAISTVKGIIPKSMSIDFESGAGNISLNNVDGKALEIETGAGNIGIHNCNFATVDASTGAGNVDLVTAKTENIDLDAGAGNIIIKSVTAHELKCNTGAGNINIFNSIAKKADCNSGIGNISVSESHFEKHDLNVGIGKINYKNGSSVTEL